MIHDFTRSRTSMRLLLPMLLLAGAGFFAVASLPLSAAGGPPPKEAAEKAEREEEPKIQTKRSLFRNALDKESGLIKRKPMPITIEAALRLPRPEKLPADRRAAPVETTLWSIEGYLTMAENREDGDVLLVLKDSKDNVLTCEMPDADDVEKSPWHKEIAAAHAAFDTKLKAMPAAERAKGPVHVRVTGIGYFGANRTSSTGRATNGFQIHPVTGIDILK